MPRLLGWDKRRIAARVDELLELVGLDPHEVRDRYPAQLSGGQRQRVGVARALAADPPVMLMDEPFGAIDPINRERLQNEFLRLQAELRKTIVFVTHDIDEAIKMGDRIAVLQVGGKLAQYAPPAELLMAPANPFVEDFVGADRALKRLALQRVRTSTCGRSRRAAPASRSPRCAPASPTPTSTSRSSSTTERRPLGWLSDADSPASGSGPSCALRRSDRRAATTSCATRCRTCSPAESMYGPVVDARGHVVGALSIQAISQAVGSAPAAVPVRRSTPRSRPPSAPRSRRADADAATGTRRRRRERP